MPPTRKDLKLPDGRVAVRLDYVQALEDTPMYTLFKLFVRQFLYVFFINHRWDRLNSSIVAFNYICCMCIYLLTHSESD
jgi:hypothetical protein